MRKQLEDYDQIEEEKVRMMAASNGPDSSFHRLLKIADEWRAANCTPVFIIASERGDEGMTIGCVSAESFGRYLN